MASNEGEGQEHRARAERIAQIYRRGLAQMRRAYDPARHLVGQGPVRPGGPPSFRPPFSLWLAHALLRDGDAAGAAEAAAIVDAFLETQERGPLHPHRGNFRWLAGDEEVTDLNAVQFALRALLPLLIDHGGRLPVDLLARSRECVALALDEEERLAVAPTYTNIHVMSLLALVVGGEWLTGQGDARGAHFLALGRARWAEYVRFTTRNGAPHEFNSPGYGAIDLGALAAVHQYAREPLVRLQARLLYERFWLHLALHLHLPTGQHAGPHCRCYWGAMIGGRAGIHDLLWRETGASFLPSLPDAPPPAAVELALTDHWLPDAVRTWLHSATRSEVPLYPYTVREIANGEEGQDLTTYFTPGYALGSASRTYAIGTDDFYIEHQSNYCLLHYRRPNGLSPARVPGPAGVPAGAIGPGFPVPPPVRGTGSQRDGPRDRDGAGWGLVYSRYVVNDQHFGRLTAAPDRPPNAFYDRGHFAGVQDRNRAIALYALQAQHEPVFSLKTVVVFPAADGLEEVWLNDRRVDVAGLPLPAQAGDWLVVADGAVYVGVYVLEPSRLGHEAPILLERGPEGELWLAIHNYRGPAVRFWDYASLRGAFWRGNLHAGYVLEVAERTEHASAAAFLAHLRRASVTDSTTSPADADSPALRTVTYRSGGAELTLRYDLWRTAPAGRAVDGQPYTPSSLDSPLAVQGASGRLAVGSATLETAPRPAWLIAQELDPATRAWIAVVPDGEPAPLRLQTPLGEITAARFGPGRLEWRAPASDSQVVLLDTVEPPTDLRLPPTVTLRT